MEINPVPFSIAEEKGYEAALDCDVLFSCVDRPRARHILNHFAYAHLIPVIDGGIDVRFRCDEFSGVDWQVQTVAPGRPCLACLKAYETGDVSTEIEGQLDDPSYISGLPKDHHFKRNENVFPFSANLASLEVLQLIALVTGVAEITDFGVQRYRYIPGIIETDTERTCSLECRIRELIAQGDRFFHLKGNDLSAEAIRAKMKTQDDQVVKHEEDNMGKKTVHVTPHSDGWQVKISGNERASELTKTQKDAIEIGRQKAQDLNTELVIHGRNGQIRDKDRYGNDPCPPKDKKN